MKPIFNKNGLIYFREEPNNAYTIMLKSHPELQQLKINKVTYEILQKCNGKNTIDNIVDALLIKYRNVSRQTLLQDILDNLHMLYRMDLIYWENNVHPFEKMYSFFFEGYKFEIMDATEVDRIFSNEAYSKLYNSRLNPTVVFGRTSLIQNIFSFNHTYMKISKNNKFLMCIGVGIIESDVDCFEILRVAYDEDCDEDVMMPNLKENWIKQCINRIQKFTAIAKDKKIVKWYVSSEKSNIADILILNGWIDATVDNKFVSDNKINKIFYLRV